MTRWFRAGWLIYMIASDIFYWVRWAVVRPHLPVYHPDLSHLDD